jgi:hypothetical protein
VDDWGHLALTESGRRLIRARGHIRGRYTILNEHVSDMSQYQTGQARIDNPMGLGPEVPAFVAVNSPADTEALINAIQSKVEPVTDYTRGLRAAGVATGVTGINVDVKWVHAFMDAFTNEQ